MTLPDRYWETHWEVAAFNTSVDEPYLDFFPTQGEAEADAARLRMEGYDNIEIRNPER